MRRPAAAAAAVVSLAALGGCAASIETSAPTRAASEAPAGRQCGVVAAARVAERFLGAVNRGEPRAIEAFIGPEFVAYSLREGDGHGARFVRLAGRTVVDYLVARQHKGERVALLVIEVNERFGRSRAGVNFVIERRAPDLRRRGIRHHLARGKGELLCSPQRIVVWNLAMPKTAAYESCGLIACPCPTPRGWDRRTSIVACAASGGRVRVIRRHEGT